MAKRRPKPSADLHARLRKHLRTNPADCVVVEQAYAPYQRANIHLALEKLLGSSDVRSELEGIIVHQQYDSVSLNKLSRAESAAWFMSGPVEYQDIIVAFDRTLACVKRGLYRITTKDGPVAVLLTDEAQYPPRISIGVMAPTRDGAQDVGRRIAALVDAAPAFRGHVLSLELNCHHELSVRYRRLPQIRREDIILPESVLQRLDRHSRGFVRNREKLRRAGRHLKRGILLHGPPGTGKTLTAMYLATQMPGRTVLILTGGGMSSIESSGVLARALAPVTVILEDVDLIGTMREHQTVGANALLFELLNQMDGLAEDADVLFVLTNRPDVLEPALASRPGRIDQAIEVPLPDPECRRRLISLYSRGLDLQVKDIERFILATDGVSAAFIRELIRRAAVLASERDGDSLLTIHDADLQNALDELSSGSALTRRLLGVEANHKRDDAE